MRSCGSCRIRGSRRYVDCIELWVYFLVDGVQGFVEKGLFDIASEYEAVFEVYCVRPGGIVAEGKGALNAVAAKMVFGIGVDVLAKAMCRVAIEGHGEHIIENDDLVRIGRS